jgi:hypothetical protein
MVCRYFITKLLMPASVSTTSRGRKQPLKSLNVHSFVARKTGSLCYYWLMPACIIGAALDKVFDRGRLKCRLAGTRDTGVRDFLKRWTRAFARDEGVAGILIAILVSITAFSALAVFMAKYVGPFRQIVAAQRTAVDAGIVQQAFLVYLSRNGTLPCPDTDASPNGTADTCNATGTTSGTLPWVTLGLSRSDAIDGFGTFYSYVVSAEAKDVCVSVGNDYNSSAALEYTGEVVDSTELEVRLTTDAAGGGRYVPFAIISHGSNRLGGISSSGTAYSSPVTGSSEETNASSAPTTIFTGPYNTGTGSSYFDDSVFALTAAQIQNLCEGKTTGEAKNAELTENFDNGTSIDSTKFTTSGSPTQSGGVANFSAANSYIATVLTNLYPNVRPVYASAYWTPTASNSGFSIATRATLTPTGDIFATGLTFRFDDRDGSTSSASPGTSNTLSIRNSSGAIATTGSGSYNIITGQEYLLEVYDNGNNVWMRVTQVSAPTNTATIQGTDTTDLSGDQKIVFINGDGASTLDDVLIGVPMLSLQTGGSSNSYAATSGTTVNGTTTGDITLEAWLKPRSLPTGTNEASIISQWDTADEDDSSFRLYLVGSTLWLDINDAAGSGDAESFNLGFGPTVNEWMHVAVSYSRTSNSIRAYQNGALVYSGTAALDSSGIQAAAHAFAVGADSVNTPPAHFFTGNVSDVRVWSDVRSATEVARCYQKRLPTSVCGTSNLVVSWTLDPTITQGGLTASTVAAAAGTAGVLYNSAVFAPAPSTYFRPISSDFCPGPGDLGTGSQGTRVGAYQCDFRVATTTTTGTSWDIDIPTNMTAIFVKVWGAGGGAYNPGSRYGGHGGFSSGMISQINSVDIAGMNIGLLAGGGGTGSATAGTGAGGGAGSFVGDLSDHISVIAGGGGGASYSNSASVSCGGSARCGDGADGAGAGSTTSTATDGSSTCGGRGGSTGTFGSNPPTGGQCPDGGGDPTGSTTTGGRGGAGTTGALGGTGTLGTVNVAGGRGYIPSESSGSPNGSAVGGGGGGGGYVGGEAGGYDDNAATTGYGGGGGSGNAASGVSGLATGTAFSDNACTANLTNNNTNVTITSCTTGSTDLAGRGWTAGMSITASGGIAAGTTIVSISGATLVMSAQATNGSNPTVTVSGTTGGASQTGTTDPDYSPSYLPSSPTDYRYPGNGGTGSANGNPGAIILRW